MFFYEPGEEILQLWALDTPRASPYEHESLKMTMMLSAVNKEKVFERDHGDRILPVGDGASITSAIFCRLQGTYLSGCPLAKTRHSAIGWVFTISRNGRQTCKPVKLVSYVASEEILLVAKGSMVSSRTTLSTSSMLRFLHPKIHA